MARPFPRPRTRRGWLLAVAGALAAAALLGVGLLALLLPGYVRRLAEERLQARLTVPVRVAEAHVNLFTGRARIADIEIGGVAGGPPILVLPALDLGLSYRALLRGRVTLRYLSFDRPRVFVERTGPERVNLLQALRPTPAGEPLAVTVEQATVRGGVVTFVDRTQTPAFERTFADITAATDAVSTLPRFRATPTSFEVRVGIGRGTLVVTGATAPFARPAGVELVARMESIEPGLLRGYLPLRARIDLRGSRVDGEVRYRLAYRGADVVENGLTARVQTGPLRLLPLDGEQPLVSVAGIAGRDITADFRDGRIRLGDVLVRQPRVRAVRDAGGLELLRLVDRAAPPRASRAAAPREGGAAPALAVSVTVGRGRVEDGTIDFVDRTTAPAATVRLQGIGLRLEDVGVGPAAGSGRVAGEARLAGGTVRWDGTVTGPGLGARVRVRASGVPIEPFRPYVEPVLRGVALARGAVGGTVDVAAAPADPAGPRLAASGRIEARDLALVLPGAREPALTARRATVELGRLQLAPAAEVDVASARIVGAVLRVARDADGSLDLQRLFAPVPGGTTGAAPADGSPAPRGRSPVLLRRVELRESRLEFSDAAVRPAFRASLEAVALDARRSPGDARRMDVELRGRLGEAAPVEAQGWATPFAGGLRLRLTGSVQDYDLAALNPYVVRYVGYRLERGRLSARLSGSYGDGRYTADTHLTIRHIAVGREVDSDFRASVGIPLPLAVSLLEGPGGEIDLHVPISGGPEGREIGFRSIVMTAVRNTLVKALAAPFRAFGTLVTLGGRIGEIRIDPVQFRPGSLEPDDAATVRLARVVDFLKDHPRLGLALRGRATAAETDALKRERLKEALEKAPPGPDTPLVAVYQSAGGRAGKSLPPAAEMERFVLDRMTITDADLRDLAGARARVIREALVRRGVTPGRLFTTPDGTPISDTGVGGVEFELVS